MLYLCMQEVNSDIDCFGNIKRKISKNTKPLIVENET